MVTLAEVLAAPHSGLMGISHRPRLMETGGGVPVKMHEERGQVLAPGNQGLKMADTRDKPKDSDAETDLAKLLVAHGDKQAAISLLEDAVKDDPTNSVAHYQLSGLYRQAGRTADAQHEMEILLHEDPKSPSITQYRQILDQLHAKQAHLAAAHEV